MNSMTHSHFNYNHSEFKQIFTVDNCDLVNRDIQRTEEFERLHPGYIQQHSPKITTIEPKTTPLKEYTTQVIHSLAAAFLATYSIFHSKSIESIETVQPQPKTHSTSIESLLK